MIRPELHLVVPGALDQPTGGYLYDARMARGLERRGWTVEVGELPGRFPDVDATAREALEKALARRPDDALVVVDGLALGGLPEVAERHAGRLVIVGLVHHPLADETGLEPGLRERLRASEAEALRACAGVVVTSPHTAERVRAMGIPDGAIRAVVPGTESARPARGPSPREPPRLLCVASVTPRKGHDVLVDALARLRDRPWECVCVGSLRRDPGHADHVRARVRREGLGARIRFEGELDPGEVERHYDRSSLFVLASRYEGYGMALAEALVRGIPVVSTTGGAIPSTVADGAGVLVPPGDAPALARALAPLLDPERGGGRRAALAAAALRAGRRLPDWDAAASSFAGALLELAPASAAGRSG